MINLEIWSEELENENNEGISTQRVHNKLEDDRREGRLPLGNFLNLYQSICEL